MRLFTRNGNDWTAKMKPLAKAVEALGLRLGLARRRDRRARRRRHADFNALQNAFDASRTDAISYFLFDLPYFDGHDLRQVPLLRAACAAAAARRRARQRRVRFSADFAADPASLLQSAAALGMEGIIAKRVDAPYVSRPQRRPG